MSRRYDSRTTIFSPEGRLYQVEYAMEAIGNAGTAIGILSKDGVVLVGEKKVTSKLLQTSTSTEKMYKIDDHVACAVAGIMSDANILINTARVQAQRYTYAYQEPMPVEQLVQSLCDTKQGYTQFGGLRPFGVSFLFAGWDKNFGFQLYMSDPSGNYGGWKAAAIETSKYTLIFSNPENPPLTRLSLLSLLSAVVSASTADDDECCQLIGIGRDILRPVKGRRKSRFPAVDGPLKSLPGSARGNFVAIRCDDLREFYMIPARFRELHRARPGVTIPASPWVTRDFTVGV
ncbi:hypothetical protein TIFTF001_018609 [Ficus carica]|uniref:Proteasome subunit alpha type n=1 Tax=Ficus carica TaxID=3494 RepID=A0AA88D840_FICCA|nr:hypothetical protein TIFTF001_018609 [Ficus carica]